MRSIKKPVAVTAAAVALAMGVAACGSGGSGGGTTGDDDAPVEITVWGWGNDENQTKLIDAFEDKYPNITIKWNNTGTASETAIALSNAIAAGSGAPDATMLEDHTVQEYAISDSLANLNELGADDFADDFMPGPWSTVHFGGEPYGLPIDVGSMAYFYNADVFAQAGITEPPATWDQFYEDAKKIRALGPDYYITNDAGDKDSFMVFNGLIWAMGGAPYSADGESVSIDFAGDSGTQQYVELWQKLIDEDLINTNVKAWSDDWYRSLGDGTIASLPIGAWMPTNLETGAPAASGQWRVAQMPQWEAGDTANSEDGGSAYVIPASSEKKDAAWKWIEFVTHDPEGVQIGMDTGTFPSLKSALQDDEFLNREYEYFGGQQINQVLVQAAENVTGEFQYLPYSNYAQSIYGDFVGKAYAQGSARIPLTEALQSFEDQLLQYGTDQGFTVE